MRWPIALISLTALTLACGNDTTPTDDDVGDTGTGDGDGDGESGSSDSSSSSDDSTDDTDSTSSDSTDSTDSDSTDSDSTDSDSTEDTDSTETGGMCDGVEDIDITLGLVGSQVPPNNCVDHEFTGTLGGGGAGIWNLDGCMCQVLCLVADPYTLTITLPDLAMLPDVPDCPSIEIRYDADCEISSMTISDLADGEPVWIGSREDVEPGTVDALNVSSESAGVCDCDDCNPPTLFDLTFDWLGTTITLSEGEQDVLMTDIGDFDVAVFSSHWYEVGDADWYAWAMKR